VTLAVALAYQVFFVDLEANQDLWPVLGLLFLAIHFGVCWLLASTGSTRTAWGRLGQTLAALVVLVIMWLPPKDWRYVSYLWRHQGSMEAQIELGRPYRNLTFLFSPRREMLRYNSMMFDDLYFIRARWGLGNQGATVGDVPVKSLRHLWGPWYYAHHD